MRSIERQARERRDFNAYSRTNRPLTPDAEALGVAGETAFAIRMLGRPSHWTPPSRSRTPGYQFRVGPWTVKIVTSHRPGTLFVKQDGVDADVYILAGCPEEIAYEQVWWCGWANSSEVRRAPMGTANRGGNYTLPSHAIKRADLQPMGALCQILGLETQEARSLMREWDRDRGLIPERREESPAPESERPPDVRQMEMI